MKTKQQIRMASSNANNSRCNEGSNERDPVLEAHLKFTFEGGESLAIIPLFEIFFRAEDGGNMKCRASRVSGEDLRAYFLSMQTLGSGTQSASADGGGYSGLVMSMDNLLTSATLGKVSILHIQHYEEGAYQKVREDALLYRRTIDAFCF